MLEGIRPIEESGTHLRRSISCRTGFDGDTCWSMDCVVPISIESTADVFGADVRKGDTKPVSKD